MGVHSPFQIYASLLLWFASILCTTSCLNAPRGSYLSIPIFMPICVTFTRYQHPLLQGVHCLYQNFVTSMFPLKVCRILSGACLFYDRFLRLQKLAILQPLWMVTTKYFFHWIQAAFNPSCLQVASTRSSPDLMTENRCHWQRVNL